MSEIQTVNQRGRHRLENMSEIQIENQRGRHRAENMTEYQIENHRERNRLENMTEYQIDNQRSRHRSENMSENQIQQHNYRNCFESMSPQQRQSLREREAVRRLFLTVAQEWDDEKPCPHCFHVYLKSVKKRARNRCCHHGAYLQEDSEYPKLNVLPEALKWLCLMRGEHFGKLSAKYNKILSIGSTTGVENHRGGGYEQIGGDHAVKMNG